MRLLIAAQVFTGQSEELVFRIDIASNFALFFWNSNVICTVVEMEDRLGLLRSISWVSSKKRTLRNFSSFVFVALFSESSTVCEYSHDLMAKNSAPQVSSAIDWLMCDEARDWMWRKIAGGRHACFLMLESASVYPRSWR